MLRRIRSQDVWLALVAVSSLAVLAVLPILFGVASDWGASFASGDAGPAATVGLLVAVAWVFQVAMAVVAGVGSYGEVDNEAGMLTIRPPKDVAGGMLLMNTVSYAVYLLVPFVAGFAGLSAGVGSPLPLAGGLAAVVAILASSMAIGYPVGLAIKGVVRRSGTLSRLKPVIGGVVVVAYFWIMFAGHLPALVDALEPATSGPPLGWLGDLALVTTPGAGASPLRAAGALALALVLVPVGTLATVRAATYAWYADPSRDDGDEVEGEGTAPAARTASAGTPPLDRVLGHLTRRQGTLGVASVTLVRAYRAPLQLVFVAAPLLFALPMVEGVVATGTVPDYAPWFAMFYGAWAAGTAFPLNLVGNQGATLPALLTARADGRQVVHGSVLAAVLPLAPVTAALAAAAAHAGGRSTTAVAAIGALSVAVVAAGALIAAGLGALFPRFDGIDVSGGRSAVPPSKAAFALFSLVVVLAVTAAGVLTDEVYHLLIHALLSEYLPFGLSVTLDGLETVSVGVAVAVAAAVPAAYLLAVRRIDDYRIE
ncbi:hypothetical protein [Halosimplex salinum]|uniref:hypothetical protein n=1 Tax=Halosimplex salinum TaxID=1710538 RepID=UPI0013DE72AD|nr:hypothetical protein [Halosimplex salinum]